MSLLQEQNSAGTDSDKGSITDKIWSLMINNPNLSQLFLFCMCEQAEWSNYEQWKMIVRHFYAERYEDIT